MGLAHKETPLHTRAVSSFALPVGFAAVLYAEHKYNAVTVVEFYSRTPIADSEAPLISAPSQFCQIAMASLSESVQCGNNTFSRLAVQIV